MSQRLPLIKAIGAGGGSNDGGSYGTVSSKDIEIGGEDETQPLVIRSKTTKGQSPSDNTDDKVTEAIFLLFLMGHHYTSDLSLYPKTNPKLPPVVRYKRHRNYYIYKLNQFRHWWKTSR